jgi:hypothetical protein
MRKLRRGDWQDGVKSVFLQQCRRTVPESTDSKALANASQATMEAISCIRALKSLASVEVERSWLILARMQG